MCGIAGFLGSAQSRIDIHVARLMADRLQHRGPDDEGLWGDPEAGIAVAQRRLSVVDLSIAGRQPMVSVGGRYVFVLNGEIYNHAEIRATLDAEGEQHWVGRSDTEVLLAAIERWGLVRALKRAVGMFALALWDRRDRVLSLARDRVGEKPLYYGRVGSSFAFASELKAFHALPAWHPDIDRDSVGLLMRHGFVPAPYSIYRGIRKLRPGQILVLTSHNAEPILENYWSAASAATRGLREPFRGTAAEAATIVEGLLEQSLRDQMIADVPLGAFLSGGIDSSTVVAVMQRLSSRPVSTFTIGLHDVDMNEAAYAKQVANHLGTDHAELYISEQAVMNVIPKLPTIYCEPFSDSSQIPTFLLAQFARRKVTVALTGDGGDELFSGYPRYDFADQLWGKLTKVPEGLRRTAAFLARRCPPAFYDKMAQAAGAILPIRVPNRVGERIHKAAALIGTPSQTGLYRAICSHWDPGEIMLDCTEPPAMPYGLGPMPPFRGEVERMMYLDLTSYLPDDILVKVDRAAMASSLETRVPLIDHRMVEFALSLPLTISRADGISKWPLRKILYKHVPQHILDRPKMGFGVPIGEWLRGGLRDWAEELLSEQRLRMDGLFRPELIRRTWLDHLSGYEANQHLLWDVLMFQAWRVAQRWPYTAAGREIF
jgi:asparagine synthase (glutamine-hydrolysing)